MTVRGPVPADSIGVTLPHEHLFFDFPIPESKERDEKVWTSVWRKMPSTSQEWRYYLETEFTAALRSQVVHNLYRTVHYPKDALILESVDTAVRELRYYRDAGGKTVTALTPEETIGRRPAKLVETAKRTDLNIVMGTGAYRDPWHPTWLIEGSVADVTSRILDELYQGVEGVRAGVIGELGASAPHTKQGDSSLSANTIKLLRGAAQASQLSGTSVVIHPTWLSSVTGEVPEAIQVLYQEGIDPDRIVLSHVTAVDDDLAYLTALASLGVYLEFDLFGFEDSIHRDWVGNEKTVQAIRHLFDAGYGEQILVSQDVALKANLREYGGHGYAYILNVLVPYMKENDFSDTEVRKLIEANPQRMLNPKPPRPLAPRRAALGYRCSSETSCRRTSTSL
jgi:phosphotriesterase-related protein